jgi:hypothetical protein
MKPITDVMLFKAMIQFGGMFVSKLGEAGLYADKVNTERLKRAFPDCVLTYTALAEMTRRANLEKESAY